MREREPEGGTGDTGDTCDTAAPPGAPPALTMPACMQNIVFLQCFQALHVRRQKLFTYMYRRACVEVYEQVCRARLVCKQSAVSGKETLDVMKKLRVRVHRYERGTAYRMYGPRCLV
jgi:hypothetical protein